MFFFCRWRFSLFTSAVFSCTVRFINYNEFKLSDFCREVDENCDLVGYYVASGGQKRGPLSCPETSVRNYHYWLRNHPEERSSHLHEVHFSAVKKERKQFENKHSPNFFRLNTCLLSSSCISFFLSFFSSFFSFFSYFRACLLAIFKPWSMNYKLVTLRNHTAQLSHIYWVGTGRRLVDRRKAVPR